MSSPQLARRTGRGLLLRIATRGLLLGLLLAAGPASGVERDTSAGRHVYETANCVGCHKWHGGGGGGYGGAAKSLRETELDRDGIIFVVRCGRPRTRMPYHDRKAAKGVDCYGVPRAELGQDAPPKAAKFLRPRQIEAVVEYVLTSLKGKGEPTREDCIAFWGEDARQCEDIK